MWLSICLCRAKDSYAQLASAWRLVQVQQQYAVAFTLPLTLPAASLSDAQTQADTLTIGSNATDALSAAISAGLVSGKSCIMDLPLSMLWLAAICAAICSAATHVATTVTQL